MENDPRLDLTRSGFDPQLALQTPQLQLPVPDAPVLDNVSKCAGFVQKDEDEEQQQAKQQVQTSKQAEEAKAKKAKAAAFKQRALQATQRAEASVKLGSLHEIMTIAAVGPFAVLAKWHAAGQRIYVVTRHTSGVRGRAVGTLVAFDKFMNVLLRDVDESYTVIVKVPRVKQQAAQGNQAETAQPGHEQHQQQQQQGASVPARTRTRWCRKQQHRHRQLDQILLRGDNIVLISGTPPSLQLPAPEAAAQAAEAGPSDAA